MPWMTRWPGAVPGSSRLRLRGSADRRGRHRVRRTVPRRHRRDDRSRAPRGHRGGRRGDGAGSDRDDAVGGRRVGRRRAVARFGAADVAGGHVGDRREPVVPSLRPAPHRPAESRGDGLVLPRDRRRDARRPLRIRRGRRAAGCARPAGRCRSHDGGGAVQRRRRRSTGGSPRATSPAACSSPPSPTSASSPRRRLPGRGPRGDPLGTVYCWWSTRRTPWVLARRVHGRWGLSDPPWSARRSATASPVAAYGMTAEVAARLNGPMLATEIDVAGVGGTLPAARWPRRRSGRPCSTCLRAEDFVGGRPPR